MCACLISMRLRREIRSLNQKNWRLQIVESVKSTGCKLLGWHKERVIEGGWSLSEAESLGG